MNTKDSPEKQIRQDAILRAVDRSLGNGLFQYPSIWTFGKRHEPMGDRYTVELMSHWY